MDPHQQVDIFADDQRQQQFAELCNALYERELAALAALTSPNLSLLQRRIGGLSHHIKRAAEQLLCSKAPIAVDVHNGSWQAKQAAKCPADRYPEDKTQAWLHQYVRPGLVIPVCVSDLGHQHIELDSVDRIDTEQRRVHVNKHGWFHFDGSPLSPDTHQYRHKRLLPANKVTCTAACCGHSWSHRGRSQPRPLSLRELLLSTDIDWKTFH
ncbi:hypothetical protein LJ739_10365 [Aestuariibacter halophilus]|uniref:Uncharacterized protein n=1 Tax=Fluctibacter halophilus TaxID=226011 RepID=A0ABS8G7X4_9ALTE|nr:hypothetical protein [Aestuariibacter halophilus]MCC2616645.1 hypothetical protein [Aestuariibacter halophilus]